MIFGAVFPGRLAPSISGSSEARLLQAEPELLAKARAYCRRLQTASLDFVCREEITETVARWTGRPEWVDSSDFQPVHVIGPADKHRLVYDYQFVRGGAVAKEMRTLIEEDGVQKEIPDADLMTRLFRYENVLFGPATLLDDRNSGRYDFEIEAEAEVGDRPAVVSRHLLRNGGMIDPAVVISARPRTSDGTSPPPFGRMWVSPTDGAVLKIEWDERTMRNYAALEERAESLKAGLRLTMTSEFGFEKNGIRFPSRHRIVEAYRRGEGKTTVKSTTVVEYVGYKFFLVETAVDFR
jgi:hypothetical protein